MTDDDTTRGGGPGETGEGVVRNQTFETTEPLDIDVNVGAGRVEIRLVDESEASVEVKTDFNLGAPWVRGIGNLMSWFTGQFGNQFGGFGPIPNQPSDVVDEAVRQTRVDLTGNRLVVRSPKDMPLRHIPLTVTIGAPSGSHVDVHSGHGDVTITGDAGRVSIDSGSGDIAVDRADGAAEMRTGSGAMRLGPMLAGLRARSGSGDVEVSSVGGSTVVNTGSGDVWLGAVQSDVMARTGSGDLTVADAACGDIELFTGSGEIRVAVRAGTAAQLDLHSGSGQARSELDVSDQRPDSEHTVRVRGKTGSGNALVTSTVG